jgi:hypothetical protein
MVNALKDNHDSVEILENISNSEYDILLSKNIVFVQLVDCTVSNTIIECIVRNTPVLINKLPAVVELLGVDYPFYYNNMNDANLKSQNIKLIEETYNYLRNLSKVKYSDGYFLDSIRNSEIYKSIVIDDCH